MTRRRLLIDALRISGLLFVYSMLALSPWCNAFAQGQSGNEDGIRAALVQHLTLYVEWPAWKLDAGHGQFRVCLIGSDPIGPALSEAFKDKPVSQRSVVVTHLANLDRVQDCHLLYVGSTAKRDVQRNAATIEQAAVLTVSERSDGGNPGQVVGLPLDESHVKVEVNLRTAMASKLVISSRLLRLATITEQP